MILLAVLVMGWFVLHLTGIGTIEIGLHSARVCQRSACESFELPTGGSAYGTFALLAFWGGLVQSLVIAYQTYARISAGVALAVTSRWGSVLGMGLVLVGVITGFILAPGIGQVETAIGDMHVDRTWGPLLYIAGQLVGIVALRASANQPAVTGEAAIRATGEHAPLLSYVVVTGEVTRAGIDARRTDASSLLVLWRDVVGFVVRRTPEELGGLTFADLVSVKGSTLRIVPSTRLTGISVAGLGDDRVRSLATYVQSICPELAIDGATKKFLAGEAAAQLRDAAMLAVHDDRLS